MSNNQAGKGDKQRPVVKKQYDENFDKIIWNKSNDNKGITKKNKTTYKY